MSILGLARQLLRGARRPDDRAADEPLVSVVLPTHDRPALLREAVESVAAQTYPNIELIVVDDASPTPAAETIDAASLGSAITLRVLRREENRGANAARNRGIGAANGEYIAFLDDDDRWEPEKLERQVEAFEQGGTDVGVVCVGQRFVDTDGRLTQHRLPTATGDVAEDLLRGAVLGPFSTIMVRAAVLEAVGPPDDRFPAWQDREWHVRLAQHCRYTTIPEPLAIRRVGTHDAIGDDYEAQREAASLYLEKHRSLAASYGRDVERKAVANVYGSVASVALAAGRYRECTRYSLRALRYDPLARKYYAYLVVSLGGPRVLEFVRTLRRTYHRSSERLG
jgi:glycosyltransferase involved in cell wall biosynthesis